MKKLLAFTHNEPQHLYKVNATQLEEDWLDDNHFYTLDVTNYDGLYLVENNDEFIEAYKTNGETEMQVKQNLIKTIKNYFTNKISYDQANDEMLQPWCVDDLEEDLGVEENVRRIFKAIKESRADRDSASKYQFMKFNSNEDYESVTSVFGLSEE